MTLRLGRWIRWALASSTVACLAAAAAGCLSTPPEESAAREQEGLAKTDGPECASQLDQLEMLRQAGKTLAAGGNVPGPTAAEASRSAAAVSQAAGACHCALVTVHCGGNGIPDGAAAACLPATCTLLLSQNMCNLYHLVDGQQVPPGSIAGNGTPPTVPPATADDIYDYCAVKHEARHSCDDPNMPACASETYAYGTGYLCLKNSYDANCGSAPPVSAFCVTLASYLQLTLAAEDFNNCLCMSGTTCQSCIDQCNARQIKPPPGTCLNLGNLYCHDNGK